MQRENGRPKQYGDDIDVKPCQDANLYDKGVSNDFIIVEVHIHFITVFNNIWHVTIERLFRETILVRITSVH